MKNIISKFLKKGSKGTTTIEYALLASLIAVVAIAAMRMIGSSITDKFQQVAETIDGDGGNGGSKLYIDYDELPELV